MRALATLCRVVQSSLCRRLTTLVKARIDADMQADRKAGMSVSEQVRCDLVCDYSEACTHPGCWAGRCQDCPTVRLIEEAGVFEEVKGDFDARYQAAKVPAGAPALF